MIRSAVFFDRSWRRGGGKSFAVLFQFGLLPAVLAVGWRTDASSQLPLGLAMLFHSRACHWGRENEFPISPALNSPSLPTLYRNWKTLTIGKRALFPSALSMPTAQQGLKFQSGRKGKAILTRLFSLAHISLEYFCRIFRSSKTFKSRSLFTNGGQTVIKRADRRNVWHLTSWCNRNTPPYFLAHLWIPSAFNQGSGWEIFEYFFWEVQVSEVIIGSKHFLSYSFVSISTAHLCEIDESFYCHRNTDEALDTLSFRCIGILSFGGQPLN